MTTEVLGFFIIVGALIVVLLRYQHQRGADAEELETSAEKLRYQLERSADDIIARMGTHIDRLEKLVAEADERSALLDRQLAELREAAELNESERTDADEFSELLAASMADGRDALNEASLQMPLPEQPMPMPAYEPVEPVAAVPGYAPVEPVYAPVQPRMPAPSLAPEPEPEFEPEPELVPDLEPTVPATARPAHVARAEEALRHRKVSPAVQARKLLAQGYSNTEIARNVHLGRGAIELIRQMENNQQN